MEEITVFCFENTIFDHPVIWVLYLDLVNLKRVVVFFLLLF